MKPSTKYLTLDQIKAQVKVFKAEYTKARWSGSPETERRNKLYKHWTDVLFAKTKEMLKEKALSLSSK